MTSLRKIKKVTFNNLLSKMHMIDQKMDETEKDVLRIILKQKWRYQQLLICYRNERNHLIKKLKSNSLSLYSIGRRGYIINSKIFNYQNEYRKISKMITTFVQSINSK